MSELVKRVARAIQAMPVRNGGYVDVADIARDAIRAMREPTIEMEIAGTEQWLCEAAMEDRAGVNWRAMIDEALR